MLKFSDKFYHALANARDAVVALQNSAHWLNANQTRAMREYVHAAKTRVDDLLGIERAAFGDLVFDYARFDRVVSMRRVALEQEHARRVKHTLTALENTFAKCEHFYSQNERAKRAQA